MYLGGIEGSHIVNTVTWNPKLKEYFSNEAIDKLLVNDTSQKQTNKQKKKQKGN